MTADSRGSGGFDLTIVHLIHGALRRDFAALARAVGSFPSGDRERARAMAVASTQLFRQLQHHHLIEDREIVPRLQRIADPRNGGTLALSRVDEQHRELEPLLDRVESGMRILAETAEAPSDLLDEVRLVQDHLIRHLDEEDSNLLPQAERCLDAHDSEQVERAAKKSMGLKETAWFFPWILDGASEDERSRVLGQLPAPLRLMYRRRWLPAYRRTALTVA